MSQSLLKAIKLLDCFKDKHELSLLDLAEVSEMPKTTIFRLVASLEETGLIVKTKYSSHDVKYKLGMKLLEFGKLVSEQMEYRKIALPYMNNINEKLNESVHLAVVEGDEAVYVEKMDSNRPIRLVIKVGARAPLYAGSASKLLLAHLDKKKREEYLKRLKLEKIAENTIEDMERLQNQLKEIREKGYAFSQQEIYKETMGFSCPIRDYSGETIAALGVSIPVTDYKEEKAKQILEEIIRATNQISIELGYTAGQEKGQG
ncbi:IclR family transcriptional regulator [Oceanobacillus longus]|uniref:IclR family transcriptional regulator n=1 Tax=Oceanobacillus longus TaxID=930120 RepID=A0ABV8H302_9BACI